MKESPPDMNYGGEAYENPPAPVVAAADPSPVGPEVDGLRNRRPSLPKKPIMSFKDAVLSGGSTKHNGKIVNSAGQVMDTLIYAAFVGVIVYVAFAKNTSGTYWYSRSLLTTFVKCPQKDGLDLVDVTAIDDIFEFVNATVLRGLYWKPLGVDEGSVLYDNALIGNPTIRMIKVRNDTCIVADGFRREIKECFGDYNDENEDRTTFGIEGQRFVWKSEEDLETLWTRGKQAYYGGGGFVVQLPKADMEQARGIIQQLKDVRFIDRGTRAVFVDFSMFNPNVNLFCVARILFELPPTGGVIAFAKVVPVDLIRYGDGYGTWIIAAEGLFCGYVLFFLLQELLEIARNRLGYFGEFWNLMDLTLVILSFACIIISFNSTKTCTRRINTLATGNPTSGTMDDAVSAVSIYSNWSSILLFLAWVKVFKYISVNKTMSQLSQTLTRSAKDIGGFAVMFCVFFFAYAQFGYLIFGGQIEDYSNFVKAMLALLRIILGDFDYVALQNANRILGPVFFVTYVFFVFFVLLNMFLAIINDSYVEVKGELNKRKGETSLMDWIRMKMTCALSRKSDGRPGPPENPMITYEEFKNEMMRVGYKEQDIIDAFTKVDVKENEQVTDAAMGMVTEEMNEMLDRKKELRQDFENYQRLRHRIDTLEASLGESGRRLDLALTMLADSEDRRAAAVEQQLKMMVADYMDKQLEK